MAKRSKSEDVTSYDLEDDGRSVILMGDIDRDSARDIIERLLNLSERSNKPIYLIVSTDGGYVDSAFAIYDTIKYIRAPVRTVGLGSISSAGCLILAAGQKGYRRMGENSMMMYHAGYNELQGNVWEQENALKEFKRQEDQYDSLFARETGLSLEQVRELYAKDRVLDRYIHPEEAVKLNIVDHIILK